MSAQKKKLIIILTAACICVGLVTWFVLSEQTGIQYRTAAVEHGDIKVAISATGNPNAVVTVQVGSQVSGIILALIADFNSQVTNGEVIAPIDPGFRPKSTRRRRTAMLRGPQS